MQTMINSVLKVDELEMSHANENVRKPGVKHNVAILAFNTCIDWVTENNISSHQILLLLEGVQ